MKNRTMITPMTPTPPVLVADIIAAARVDGLSSRPGRAIRLRTLVAILTCAGSSTGVAFSQAPSAGSQPAQSDAASQPSPAAVPVTQAASTLATAPVPAAAVAGAPPENISFNFKDTPIDQALDFFARECGVPIIFEAPAPAGTITFISPSSYPLADALSILNLNLARYGVHLRRQDQYMYLATLADSMKKPAVISTIDGVDKLSPDLIVTISIPLDNARAELVAEQVKPLISPIGGIIAVQAQNMIVLVESAAQVRRLRDIISAIDAVRPVDSAFRLFPLRHSQAETILTALKGLVGEKITTVIVDKDGQKRTIQEQNLAGLNLAADARTNSVVAVGSASRLKTVEELIALLDTPESSNIGGAPSAGPDQQMQTFSLSQTSPEEAARQLNALFANADPKKKPVVIPLESVSKITVVGPGPAIAQAGALLAQIDPDVNSTQGGPPSRAERRGAVIPLTFASASAIEPLLTKLLPQRLVQTVKFAASPDGRAIVVTGPAADVAQFEQVIAALDVQNSADQQVKVIYLSGLEPAAAAATIARAQDAYSKAGKAKVAPIAVSMDPATQAATIIAPAGAIKDFEAIVSSMATIAAGSVQTRTFIVTKSLPSQLTAKLIRLAAVILSTPPEFRPAIESIDELKTIVMKGREQDVTLLAGLLERLDGTDLPARDLRVIPLPAMSPAQARALKERAASLYAQQIQPANVTDPATVTFDESSNALVVLAPRVELDRFAGIVSELEKQVGPVREIRLFELKLAKAQEVADFLVDMSASSRTLIATNGPPPVFEVIEGTNSILAAAHAQQFAVIDTLIKSLDSRQAADRPPVRILKLRSTDAANLAIVLQREFDKRPIEQRGKNPVGIEADAGTNTLIVSAAGDAFEEIEKLVTSLNETDAAGGGEGRELRIFPLKVARAEELAQTIDQMFPQLPVPLDPRTRQPRPDLQPPREVVVRADRATNSLIVDAPAKRLAGFEQLVKSLDATKIAADVVFRTYKIERADIETVARAIRDLATGGALASKATSAPTIVNTEPTTRTLIVSTHQEAFAIIEEVIAKMDASPKVATTDLKLFPLTTARADQLQPLIQRILSAKWREIQLAEGKGTSAATTIEVNADTASNTIIISAPSQLIATADAIITSLDVKSAASATELRVFRLGKGSAVSAAQSISAAVKAQGGPGETEATITPEATSNTVTVVGTGAQIERAATLIQALDVAVDLEGMGVRTLLLTKARAIALAPLLQQILESESSLDKLPEWAKMQAIARGAVESPKVRVVGDARRNAIIISGPRAVLDLAEQVVTELDKGDVFDSQRRTIRVITIENADAQKTADNIAAVFGDEHDVQEVPTIRVDPQANTLIIKATDSQLDVISQLVKSMDSAAAVSSRQFRTIGVDKSKMDAELLARTIERLMKGQGTSKVEVISAEELLKRQSKPKKATFHYIPLNEVYLLPARGSRALAQFDREASSPFLPSLSPLLVAAVAAAVLTFIPSNAAGSLQPDLVGPPSPASETETATDNVVTIAVDQATNSLIVVGSPRATDRVAQLARQLSDSMPASPANVRIVTLAGGTDATALAQVINQTIAQLVQTSPAGGGGGAGRGGGFTGPVNVTTDPAGGALIVLANDTDFETVASLIANIAAIDNSIPTTIKVVPLANVSAQRAIQAVRELFAGGQGAQAKRIRSLDVTITNSKGESITADRIDPALVRISSDASGSSLLIAAPTQAMPLIDALIETIDQSPVKDRLAIRRYSLANARALDLAPTLQSLFDGQRQGVNAAENPQARFVSDERTNSLLVTASATQHAEVDRLLATVDGSAQVPGLELAIITLQQAAPEAVRKMTEEVIIGKDPAKRERIRMSAQEGSNILIVRALPEEVAQIKSLVAQIDSAEVAGLPVRSAKLERADAATVAQALQQFFTQRAQISSRPGQRVVNRVAIAGDKRTGSLIICASDEDFKQIQELIKTFDSPSPATDMVFKIVPLNNTRTTDIADTIRNIIDEVRWTSMVGGNANNTDQQVFIETNDAANCVVLLGQGEQLAMVERLITAMDVPAEQRAEMTVRSVLIKNADLQAVKLVLERAFMTPNWRSWRGPDPAAVTVQVDRLRKGLILVGKADQIEKAVSYIAQLDDAPEGAKRGIEAIALNHARAERAATNLRQFFTDRVRAQGLETASPVSIIGSPDGNVIIASAQEDDLKTLRDLIAQIDQPDSGKDRRVEVFILRNGVARDTADVLRSMFTKADSPSDRVVVTPQPSTNALVISAPDKLFDEVVLLLKQLDAPPKADEANIETVSLTTAKAADVATALRAALPPNVKVTVTPVIRSNSLLLTGSKEAIALVVEQIKKIDTEPMRSGAVFRRYTLANVDVSTVTSTLEQVLDARPKGPNEVSASVDYSRADNTITVYAPADQIVELEAIIKELDVPVAEERTTEFVKLDFANAQQTADALKVFYGRFASEAVTPAARNVTILSDPLSNSLVIRADKKQWEGIRALLTKLDTSEYDTKRQLAVVPLTYADAASIARALNEGFRAPLEEQLRQAQTRVAAQNRTNAARNQFQLTEPTVLVDATDLPSVSAEPQTNSLVVFAGQKDLSRIMLAVKQLDVSGFAGMPSARIIPLRSGKPSVVASTIRELFLNKTDRSPQASGPRAVIIIGDDASGSLIVRADDEKFAQVKALAETLEQQGQVGRVMPHVIRLRSVAAARLRVTLLATFSEIARQQGETLAIEVDRNANALVIAASERLLAEIRKVIEELDAPVIDPDQVGPVMPTANLNQSVYIIDITNNAPSEIKRLLEEMGVTRPAPPDRPGVVAEPVTITVMSSRRAIAVVAGGGDGRAIESLVKALDASPTDPQQVVAVLPLKMASAKPVADTLTAMFNPALQVAETGPAKALAEQIRRLSIIKNGAEQTEKQLDLGKPIRIIADAEANSLIIISTQVNVDAIREVIKLLDTLPIGDAVIVRIFPMSNASATRVQQVITQLFSQGEALRRLPGTRRQGLPPTATGQALAGEIAAAVDERTNTLIVAGREEAVALVEVLIKDLDSDRAANWIEPAIIPLKHADASVLARKLQDVLVRGLTSTPESMGLQRQFGRLRIAAQLPDASTLSTPTLTTPPGAPATEPGTPTPPAISILTPPILSDLFAPVTGLVITADEQLNSLIVVATPANIKIVRALVAQLDVEAASASNTVRIFPLQHAASERVASILRDLFRQRELLPDTRPEDKLIISNDLRTNSLIVATSPKSIAIVEGMLKTLDGEKSNFSVGLHILTVTGADARALAPRIDRLMRERISAAAQTGGVRNPLDAFSIEAEPLSNLLIIASSDENLAVVKELITALTADAAKLAAGERIDMIQLTKARAAEAAASLTALYADKENLRRGPNAVSVTPNERLNSLIFSGTEQDMIELRSLAKKIDSAEVAALQQIKWIELKSANASEVVTLIESVIAGRPVGGGRGVGARQASKLQFLREQLDLVVGDGRKPTEAEIDGAIKDQVTLNADPRTNSIWITAPETMVTLITEMIMEIERSSAGSRKIEKFTLLNADARQMAELLRDTFKLEQRGNAMVLLPQGTRPARSDNPADNTTDNSTEPGGISDLPNVTAVPDERQQLAIAVDARTNTLIVSGTEEYLELVRKVIQELDGIAANERDRRVYSLRNAKAREIETTLRSYFRGENDSERVTLGPQLSGALMRRLEQEVTVVGDEKSNKLVISTSPRYMQTVLSIVDELDTPPPQVMIQVLLAEVTLDTTEQWGMDISVGPFGGEAYNVGSLAGGSGVATALGVPNLSVTSADFGILIRSLEAQGKLEILSNPQVTVNNNQKAEINVGDEIGVAGSTERSSIGTLISSVERLPVGIIMSVTPAISDDGFVRMEINPQISQLTNRTTQINRDQTAPIIARRRVDTVVTVKDGQSVVIGGLIQTTQEERRSKVPILGDIPFLGLPFRTKLQEARKTELLVIVTPRVIPGLPGSAHGMAQDVSNQQIDRMEDPTRVLDYLESIKADIKATRTKQAEETPAEGAIDPQTGLPIDPAFNDPATSPPPTPTSDTNLTPDLSLPKPTSSVAPASPAAHLLVPSTARTKPPR